MSIPAYGTIDIAVYAEAGTISVLDSLFSKERRVPVLRVDAWQHLK